jgi:hypothetical protein
MFAELKKRAEERENKIKAVGEKQSPRKKSAKSAKSAKVDPILKKAILDLGKEKTFLEIETNMTETQKEQLKQAEEEKRRELEQASKAIRETERLVRLERMTKRQAERANSDAYKPKPHSIASRTASLTSRRVHVPPAIAELVNSKAITPNVNTPDIGDLRTARTELTANDDMLTAGGKRTRRRYNNYKKTRKGRVNNRRRKIKSRKIKTFTRQK